MRELTTRHDTSPPVMLRQTHAGSTRWSGTTILVTLPHTPVLVFPLFNNRLRERERSGETRRKEAASENWPACGGFYSSGAAVAALSTALQESV